MLVLVPNYNKAQYITETLDCLKNQTFQDFECFIADDGSTDGSRHVIQEWIKTNKKTEQFFENPQIFNLGIATTLNRNFILANNLGHKFVIVIASDDLVEPTWIEEMVKLQKETNADFVSTGGVQFGENNNTFTECSAGLYKVSTWLELGGRDKNKPAIHDVDFKFKLFVNTKRKRLVKKQLYKWRTYPEQSSRQFGDTSQLILNSMIEHKINPDLKTDILTKNFN